MVAGGQLDRLALAQAGLPEPVVEDGSRPPATPDEAGQHAEDARDQARDEDRDDDPGPCVLEPLQRLVQSSLPSRLSPTFTFKPPLPPRMSLRLIMYPLAISIASALSMPASTSFV